MPEPILRTVTRTQGNNAAIKDGSVKPAGFTLAIEEVPVLVHAFRRMVRSLEFDVCEMALTTYLCAREHGVKFTALPVFLVRAFHHGAILKNVKSGIRAPKDLEGRKVGVNRGYTVTTGVWARGILQEEYGVDLGKITWILSGDEHVADYVPPANVQPIEPGGKIEDMLAAGELGAAIGVSVDHEDVRPLIENPMAAGFAALKRSGHYPINHLIVIKDDVIDAYPGVAAAVFDAFAESKRRYLERLAAHAIAAPTAVDDFYARVMEVQADPLPYGLAPNRDTLETLVAHAATQGILKEPADLDALFARDTLELTA